MTSTSQPSEFGELNFTAGTIGGAANLIVNGAMTWNDGTLTADTTTAEQRSTARSRSVAATTFCTCGRSTSTRTRPGRAAESFRLRGDDQQRRGPHLRRQDEYGLPVLGRERRQFNNSGAVTKTVDTTVTDFPSGIVFNNAGSVTVTTGTLDFGGGGTSTGSFNVGPAAALAFSGGTHTLTPVSTLGGSGSLSFLGGTTNVNGSYTHTGPLSVSSGVVNFTPAFNNNALAVTFGHPECERRIQRVVARL